MNWFKIKKKKIDNNFLKAMSTLVGTIIGVGAFAIPFVFLRGGITLGIVFLIVVGAVITMIHLMYGEIALRTKKRHRLSGYAKKYLPGKIWIWVGVITVVSLSGALLAYLIIGGKFLSILLGSSLGENQTIYVLIFFLFGSSVIFREKRIFADAEELFTAILIIIMFFIFIIGIPYFSFSNLNFATIDISKSFLVYGIVFFALSGFSTVPELKEIFAETEHREDKLKKAIIWGSLLPIVFYIVFAIMVIGISGGNTSEEAISGLGLGNGALILGAIMGLLATITSFWALGLTLKKIFWYDYGINKNVAWAIACLMPLIMYFLGFTNFISVIATIGGVLGAIEGTIMIAVYLRAKKLGERKPEYSLNIPKPVFYIIPVTFLLIIIYELSNF